MLAFRTICRGALGFVLAVIGSLTPFLAQGQGCLGACQPVSTGPWTTFNEDTTQGALPYDRINALWVETGQAVWVGTDGGLSRYDGHAWYLYTRVDGLAGEEIQALSSDGTGGLWVGTISGLSHFDGASWKTFATADGLTDNWVRSLALDNKGELWIGTLCGVARFDGQEYVLRIAELDGQLFGPATAVLPTRDGGAFFAVRNEVVYVSRQGATRRYGSAAGLKGGRVQALADAGGGELWVGTALGLYLFSAGAFNPVALANGAAEAEPDILSLAKDGEGGLWLGTPEGLLHFDGQQIDLRLTASKSGLAADRVQVIRRTDDGILWLGTTAGVSRWNPEAWLVFPAAGSNIRAITGEGEWVWANSEQGVAVWDGNDWGLLSEREAYGLCFFGDALWFGNVDGLQRLDPAGVITVGNGQLAGRQPRAIAGDRSGNLWVGTNEGLFHLRDGALIHEYHTADGLISDVVNALLVEPEIIWAGTSDGLMLGDGEMWRMVTWGGEILANRVRALARGKDGSVWVATDAGLRRLPPDGDPVDAASWLLYTCQDGLVSDAVNALWTDPNGQLWVGTNGGLSGLDDNGTLDRQDDVWVSLTTDDGLDANRVTALWRDTKGVLWIGTEAGVVRHVPVFQVPSPDIAGIRAEGGLLPVWPELKLEWDQVDVDLEFHGASLATERFTYRYQLTGNDWQVTTEPRAGLFLEPGKSYDITVQVFDADLNAAPPVSTTFSVGAVPLLQQRWFQFLLGAILLAVGAPLGVQARRWWFRWRPLSYRDLEVIFVPGAELETYRVRCRGQGLRKELEYPVQLDRVSLEKRRLEIKPGSSDEPFLRYLGGALYQALFSDVKAKQVVSHLRLRRGPRRRSVRLRLHLDCAPELNSLPWELLYGGEQMGFLGTRVKDIALVRYAEPQEGWERPHLTRRMRVLIVLALPDHPNVPQLDLAEEKKTLEKVLAALPQVETVTFLVGPHAARQLMKSLVYDDDVSISQMEAVEFLIGPYAAREMGMKATLDDDDMINALNKALTQEEGWDVVHLSGHAGREALPTGEEGEVTLWLEDAEGRYRPMDAQQLETLLNKLDAQKTPKLVVLNACRTAEAVGGLVDVFLRGGVGAVVGMQWPVKDDAAQEFAEGFYTVLVQYGQVDYAVSEGRNRAAQKGIGRCDWSAPVLVMQTEDGFIFERV